MTYSQYKEYLTQEKDIELWTARVQVLWYLHETEAMRYNGRAEAKEKLELWKKSLEQKEKQRNQLDEMFAVTDPTYTEKHD